MEYISMSIKEKEQVKVFEQLVRREITQKAASEMLNLTERQIRNKLRIYRLDGAASLVHKNRGKVSKKKWCKEEEAFVIVQLRDEIWNDFGPTFASEKLQEYHHITINRETLRQSMIKHGLWVPRKSTPNRRKKREQKRVFGIMIQLDGSKHKWFEDGQYYTLLVFIDDATKKLVHLEFAESESLKSIMLATRKYMENYGRPRSFYVDHGSVFKVSVNNADDEKLSQWERAMNELGTIVHHAGSPQAKGRVEKSHQTHQDRLVKEMRLLGIRSLEKANQFLPKYIEEHNRKYSVEAAEQGDAHQSLQNFNLDNIFCIHEKRKIQNDYTVQYKKRILQLKDKRNVKYRPKDEVTIKESFSGSIAIFIRGYELEYKELQQRPQKFVKEKIYNNQKPKPVPSSKRWNNNGICRKKPFIHQPRIY